MLSMQFCLHKYFSKLKKYKCLGETPLHNHCEIFNKKEKNKNLLKRFCLRKILEKIKIFVGWRVHSKHIWTIRYHAKITVLRFSVRIPRMVHWKSAYRALCHSAGIYSTFCAVQPKSDIRVPALATTTFLENFFENSHMFTCGTRAAPSAHHFRLWHPQGCRDCTVKSHKCGEKLTD